MYHCPNRPCNLEPKWSFRVWGKVIPFLPMVSKFVGILEEVMPLMFVRWSFAVPTVTYL